MTRSKRTALASLERVESGLALGLQLGGFGGVLPHDEQTRDQAEDEGDDSDDHKIKRDGGRGGSSRR